MRQTRVFYLYFFLLLLRGVNLIYALREAGSVALAATSAEAATSTEADYAPRQQREMFFFFAPFGFLI